MATKRTAAEDGLLVEMLKMEHFGLVAAIAAFFRDFLTGDQLPSEEWTETKLGVIFKKVYPSLPDYCRPIAIISVIAVLFSIIRYRRIASHIDKSLAEEQFGFGQAVDAATPCMC